jgi:hypothetical protein
MCTDEAVDILSVIVNNNLKYFAYLPKIDKI